MELTGNSTVRFNVEFCISRIVCNILRKDAIFQKIEFRCQSIVDVRDIAESQHNIPLSINARARAFEYSRSCVKSAFQHGLDPSGYREKQTPFEPDCEQQILDRIKQNPERNQGLLPELIQFQVPITHSWVNSFVLRYPDEIIQASADTPWSQDFRSRSIFEELKRTPKKLPQLLSYREVADRRFHKKAGPIKIDRLTDRDAMKK